MMICYLAINRAKEFVSSSVRPLQSATEASLLDDLNKIYFNPDILRQINRITWKY
jgi:recombinational DNA repair protein (RecF pathway)